MVYLKHDIEGFRPEWCISSMILRVPGRMVYLKHDIEGSRENGVSQA